MILTKKASVALVAYLMLSAPAYSDSCSTSAEGSSDDARAYLTLDRQLQSNTCTAEALTRLAQTGTDKDMIVLAQYLDFVQPGLQGILVLQNDNVTSIYPAVKAFVGIGRRAMPVLIGVLKSPNQAYSIRRNAGRAVRLIYEDDPVLAIRLLVSAKAESGMERKMLEQAALWISEWCPESTRAACESEYNGRIESGAR